MPRLCLFGNGSPRRSRSSLLQPRFCLLPPRRQLQISFDDRPRFYDMTSVHLFRIPSVSPVARRPLQGLQRLDTCRQLEGGPGHPYLPTSFDRTLAFVYIICIIAQLVLPVACIIPIHPHLPTYLPTHPVWCSYLFIFIFHFVLVSPARVLWTANFIRLSLHPCLFL